ARRPVLHNGEHQRHDAFGDCRVAVGEEMEPAVLLRRIDPYTGRAPAHQRGIGFQRLRHFVEFAAELYQQAVPFIGVKEFVLFEYVGEGTHVRPLAHQASRSTPLALASSLRIRSLRSAISIRVAPSRALLSISIGRLTTSSSRSLS